jgi:hypothetical protein
MVTKHYRVLGVGKSEVAVFFFAGRDANSINRDLQRNPGSIGLVLIDPVPITAVL